MDLPPTGDIALVVAGAAVAGFVNGLSGTGYALVALGFWLHAMSPITAAPLVAFCSVCGHVQSLPRIWQGVVWSRLWPFLLGGLIGVPLGTALLAHVQVKPLKIGVGLLLIFYSPGWPSSAARRWCGPAAGWPTARPASAAACWAAWRASAAPSP